MSPTASKSATPATKTASKTAKKTAAKTAKRTAAKRTPVRMWFDPACPWAWMTSRWLMEVEKVRDIDVTWNVMSLSVLNEKRELDKGYRAMMDKSWAPVRVVIAARETYGEAYVKPLYDAMGTRIHPGGDHDYQSVVVGAVADVGLPESLAKAATMKKWDAALRRSHKEGISLVGTDVGTPVIALEGTAFFGPVVTPAPKGEAAGKLWDGCVLVSSTPGFYELKRTRDASPIFD